MCGIAGIVYFDGRLPGRDPIGAMTEAIAHRGPDAEGFLLEPGIALGHRRLSIIDLSSASNQPLFDHTSRWALIFNGEMYNYAEVKARLREYPFRTSGDTEVVLAAFDSWGPECLAQFRGMYAFALWDRQKREIFLARDPMGVKPLYYYLDQDKLVFASEIRAILASGLVPRKLNTGSLWDYFSYQSISGRDAAIQGIRQLESGSWMRVRDGSPEITRYWDVSSSRIAFDWSQEASVKQRVRELLMQSVRRRQVSDVPVGVFLSGGIDSSAVVGLMAESGARPNTFHIAFDEKDYDESPYADAVVRKFQTHHTRILVQPTAMLDQLETALDAMDTPTGDGINTFLVSRAVRKTGMKVALSGAGGDELFAGYPFFAKYLRWQKLHWLWKLPLAIRRLPLTAMANGTRRDRMQQLVRGGAPDITRAYPVIRQIHSPSRMYELTSLESPHPQSTAVQQGLIERQDNLNRLPLLSQVTAAEYLGYTQFTLLKDLDQMSMAFALEVREPYFDQDLVEFTLSIPDRLKNPVYPKSLLVESLKPLLPDEIVFRKKQGFLFPWALWMKNELRSFCEQQTQRMAERSFIHGERLRAFWQSFLQGEPGIRWAEVWLFVVLEHWMDKNGIEE